ncbi:MAG: hypothetical protein ACLQOO_37445 [Terriglobia bacterium]
MTRLPISALVAAVSILGAVSLRAQSGSESAAIAESVAVRGRRSG